MKPIANSAGKSWSETAGVASAADERRVSKSITFSREADWAMTLPKIWWFFVLGATKKPMDKGVGFAERELLDHDGGDVVVRAAAAAALFAFERFNEKGARRELLVEFERVKTDTNFYCTVTLTLLGEGGKLRSLTRWDCTRW